MKASIIFKRKLKSEEMPRRNASGRVGYALGTAAAAGGLAWWTAARFRRWRKELVEHLHSGSTVRQTACGPVEYAVTGEGAPVLVSHGMLGGYDQGIVIARLIGLPCFRFIAVSRPGYLRTPLQTGRTFDEQSDSFAALIDSLGISRAAIIGVSAGGPAALAFARRHPERCAGLVLMSAVTRRLAREQVEVPLAMVLATSAFADFGYWSLRRFAFLSPRFAAAGMLLQDELIMWEDASAKASLLRLADTFVPLSLRRAGMFNDEIQIASLADSVSPVQCARVLIVHGTMDGLVPYRNATEAAAAIPGSKLMPIDGGGHLSAILHAAQIRSVITDFLV